MLCTLACNKQMRTISSWPINIIELLLQDTSNLKFACHMHMCQLWICFQDMDEQAPRGPSSSHSASQWRLFRRHLVGKRPAVDMNGVSCSVTWKQRKASLVSVKAVT